MKNLRTLVIVGFLFLATAAGLAAPNITTTLRKEANLENLENGDPEHIEKEEQKHRSPGRQIICTLDKDYGIHFQDQETPEILSYGIYDVTGGCVAVFGDEESFIDFLFTLSGEYQLRFTTASYDLVGYIYL